jgi:membrane protein DedA with SNARE-associated domain
MSFNWAAAASAMVWVPVIVLGTMLVIFTIIEVIKMETKERLILAAVVAALALIFVIGGVLGAS